VTRLPETKPVIRRQRNGLAPRTYRGNCPTCKYAMYADQKLTWSVRPVTGTVHAWCVTNATKEN
jgi:hypothetical protein